MVNRKSYPNWNSNKISFELLMCLLWEITAHLLENRERKKIKNKKRKKKKKKNGKQHICTSFSF